MKTFEPYRGMEFRWALALGRGIGAQLAAVGSVEMEVARLAGDLPFRFMDEYVMMPAQQDKVPDSGFAAGKKMPTLTRIDRGSSRPVTRTRTRLMTATSARSTTIAVATRSVAVVQVEIWSIWICEPPIAETT